MVCCHPRGCQASDTAQRLSSKGVRDLTGSRVVQCEVLVSLAKSLTIVTVMNVATFAILGPGVCCGRTGRPFCALLSV